MARDWGSSAECAVDSNLFTTIGFEFVRGLLSNPVTAQQSLFGVLQQVASKVLRDPPVVEVCASYNCTNSH
jgi:hypothetical protein